MQSLQAYQEFINSELVKRIESSEYNEPKGLYEPCAYILKNGGKRVRATLVLMAAKLFANNYENAISVALAFETFHNFTLIHDDIMDDADIRRGQATVHVKWDENTAILSGDAVMILAYKFFEESPEHVIKLFSLLNTTALEVCEGQQYDIDLENANLLDSFVSEEMYIKMIELKTSVLIAACLKAGAIIGGASEEEALKLYEFGKNVGIAFQLQDDLLDSFGDVETFGKKIGGDIAENKKTYLVIKALELLPENDKQKLLDLYQQKENSSKKYDEVIDLYKKANVEKITEELVDTYFAQATNCIKSVSIEESKKSELYAFMHDLRERAF